jgi:hypothetical protein
MPRLRATHGLRTSVTGARVKTHRPTDFAHYSAGVRHGIRADLRLAEMNADQVRALDHEKTVILIPGGIPEEHGPYLPVYTDGYANRYSESHPVIMLQAPRMLLNFKRILDFDEGQVVKLRCFRGT